MTERARTIKWWVHAAVGFLIGGAAVLLAARPHGGWRLDIYYVASAVSGLYLGGAKGRWAGRTTAAAVGHFAAAFAWAWPYLRVGDGLALFYPMFKVPIAVSLMGAVAALIAVLSAVRPAVNDSASEEV